MGVIIRQSIKGTIINYVGAFIGALTHMFIVTYFLLPEDIGLTKVILEIGIMFGALCQLGTSASIMRYFPYFKNEKKNHHGFFFYIAILPLIGSCIFIPLYLLFREPIITFFARSSSLFTAYYYWEILLIVIMAYWAALETYSNVNMRIVVPKFNREIGVRLLFIVVYLLYGYNLIDRDGLVMGMILLYGFILLVTLGYIRRTCVTSLKCDFSYVDKELRMNFVKYTSYLMVGALGTTMMGRLDIFMLSSQMGFEYTGVYAIVMYIAVMVEIPSRSITAISSPIAANALKNNDFNTANALYKKVSLHQLILGGGIFVLIWVNIDNIFAIIPNGEVYAEGKWVVFFICISKLIEVTLNFGGVLISFSRYYYWSLFFTFFIIVIGITANYLLIPIIGITGAAIATMITSLLTFSVQQWIVLKKVKGNPYTKGTIKVLLLMILLWGLNMVSVKIDNPWLDGLLRTFLTGVTGICLLYYFRISTEVNALIDSVMSKIKR